MFMRTPFVSRTQLEQNHLKKPLLWSIHLPPFSHNVFSPACNHHLQNQTLFPCKTCWYLSTRPYLEALRWGDLYYKSFSQLATCTESLMDTAVFIHLPFQSFSIFLFTSCYTSIIHCYDRSLLSPRKDDDKAHSSLHVSYSLIFSRCLYALT